MAVWAAVQPMGGCWCGDEAYRVPMQDCLTAPSVAPAGCDVAAVPTLSAATPTDHPLLLEVLQRLAELEQRISDWNGEQQRRLELALQARDPPWPPEQEQEQEQDVGRDFVAAGKTPTDERVQQLSRCSSGTLEPEPSPTSCSDASPSPLAQLCEEPSCHSAHRHRGADGQPLSVPRPLEGELPRKRHSVLEPFRKEPSLRQDSLLARVVVHPAFNYFFTGIVLLNSIFIGVHTQMHGVAEPFFKVTEKVFVLLFTVELILRIAVEKRHFLVGWERWWNLFDVILVFLSVFDLVFEASASSSDGVGTNNQVGKVVHVAHMVRIIRIVRLLRFLSQLRVMMNLIMSSLKELFWLVVLLVLILYVFSILFTQAVYDILHEGDALDMEAYTPLLDRHFGSIWNSAMTLFMCITGGMPWYQLIEPLYRGSWLLVVLLFLYIIFCTFSVLNIITGVFVDGAMRRASHDREARLEKDREQREAYVRTVVEFLKGIDKEGVGVVSRESLEVAFEDKCWRPYFALLEIEAPTPGSLFEMLDAEGAGVLDVEAFVAGCLRLKGAARSADIHALTCKLTKLMSRWDTVLERQAVAALAARQPRTCRR